MNDPRRRVSALALCVAATVVGTAVTLLVVLVPSLEFAYRSPRAHLVLENFDASVAALIAVLFFGRHRRTRSSRDLLISAAFAVLTTSGVLLAFTPISENRHHLLWTVWVPLIVRLLAAGLIALAAANPRRRLSGGRPVVTVTLIVTAVLAVTVAAGAIIRNHLPEPLNPLLSPTASTHPLVVGHPAILTAQAVHAVMYAYAAVAFMRQAARDNDVLTRALAVGCTLGTFARINYFLFPSLFSQWLYAGDFLRTAFYLTLGIGAVYELVGYWNAHAEAAVFAERRRLARDLHDGTVQELGYIRTLARNLRDSHGGDATADRIAAAADRALAEARHAIAALSIPLDEPLVEVFRRATAEVADRYDIDIDVNGTAAPHPDAASREALVRIVREAVANAARHGDASHITVQLVDHEIAIVDDGHGFDPGAVPAGAYGLVSMHERAEAIGGTLEVQSEAGRGTTVRVRW